MGVCCSFSKSVFPNYNIQWDDPLPIEYGTSLSAWQLNAEISGNIKGNFIYEPDFDTILGTGKHKLKVTFISDDKTIQLEKFVVLIITQKRPIFTWNPFPEIFEGVALNSKYHLNAYVEDNVSGVFQYSVSEGDILEGPGEHTLGCHFVPSDGHNYSEESLMVTIIVSKKPEIIWNTIPDIHYPYQLTSKELCAKLSCTISNNFTSGKFEYSPNLDTILDSGIHQLTVRYIPDDVLSFGIEEIVGNQTINVLKGYPYVVWEAPRYIFEGCTLNDTQHLTAKTRSYWKEIENQPIDGITENIGNIVNQRESEAASSSLLGFDLTIVRAQNLCKTDFIGLTDPFVEARWVWGYHKSSNSIRGRKDKKKKTKSNRSSPTNRRSPSSSRSSRSSPTNHRSPSPKASRSSPVNIDITNDVDNDPCDNLSTTFAENTKSEVGLGLDVELANLDLELKAGRNNRNNDDEDIGKLLFRTSVQDNTLEPIWNESFHLDTPHSSVISATTGSTTGSENDHKRDSRSIIATFPQMNQTSNIENNANNVDGSSETALNTKNEISSGSEGRYSSYRTSKLRVNTDLSLDDYDDGDEDTGGRDGQSNSEKVLLLLLDLHDMNTLGTGKFLGSTAIPYTTLCNYPSRIRKSTTREGESESNMEEIELKLQSRADKGDKYVGGKLFLKWSLILPEPKVITTNPKRQVERLMMPAVNGEFTYDPPLHSVIQPTTGDGVKIKKQVQLRARFEPEDAMNYNSVEMEIQLVVVPAPVLKWDSWMIKKQRHLRSTSNQSRDRSGETGVSSAKPNPNTEEIKDVGYNDSNKSEYLRLQYGTKFNREELLSVTSISYPHLQYLNDESDVEPPLVSATVWIITTSHFSNDEIRTEQEEYEVVKDEMDEKSQSQMIKPGIGSFDFAAGEVNLRSTLETDDENDSVKREGDASTPNLVDIGRHRLHVIFTPFSIQAQQYGLNQLTTYCLVEIYPAPLQLNWLPAQYIFYGACMSESNHLTAIAALSDDAEQIDESLGPIDINGLLEFRPPRGDRVFGRKRKISKEKKEIPSNDEKKKRSKYTKLIPKEEEEYMDGDWLLVRATFTPNTNNFETVVDKRWIEVLPTPRILWDTSHAAFVDIVYPQPIGAAQLTAELDVDVRVANHPDYQGTMSYNFDAGTVLSVGKHRLVATFTPNNPDAFGIPHISQARDVSVHLPERHDCEIQWDPNEGQGVSPMRVGFTIQSKHLLAIAWDMFEVNAGVDSSAVPIRVDGTWEFDPPLDTRVLEAGSIDITATFTPKNLVTHAPATITRQLRVEIALPRISWHPLEEYLYGLYLKEDVFTAHAMVSYDKNEFENFNNNMGVDIGKNEEGIQHRKDEDDTSDDGLVWQGHFDYYEVREDDNILLTGEEQLPLGLITMKCVFIPSNPQHVASAHLRVAFTIIPNRIQLEWQTPGDVYYGTPLSEVHLSAHVVRPIEARLPSRFGIFEYSHLEGQILPAGKHTLSVIFTPDDRFGDGFLPGETEVEIVVRPSALDVKVSVLPHTCKNSNGSRRVTYGNILAEFISSPTIAWMSPSEIRMADKNHSSLSWMPSYDDRYDDRATTAPTSASFSSLASKYMKVRESKNTDTDANKDYVSMIRVQTAPSRSKSENQVMDDSVSLIPSSLLTSLNVNATSHLTRVTNDGFVEIDTSITRKKDDINNNIGGNSHTYGFEPAYPHINDNEHGYFVRPPLIRVGHLSSLSSSPSIRTLTAVDTNVGSNSRNILMDDTGGTVHDWKGLADSSELYLNLGKKTGKKKKKNKISNSKTNLSISDTFTGKEKSKQHQQQHQQSSKRKGRSTTPSQKLLMSSLVDVKDRAQINSSSSNFSTQLDVNIDVDTTISDNRDIGSSLFESERAATLPTGCFKCQPVAIDQLPTAGIHSITVTFYPDDKDNFLVSSKEIQILVDKLTPSVDWLELLPKECLTIRVGVPLDSKYLCAALRCPDLESRLQEEETLDTLFDCQYDPPLHHVFADSDVGCRRLYVRFEPKGRLIDNCDAAGAFVEIQVIKPMTREAIDRLSKPFNRQSSQ